VEVVYRGVNVDGNQRKYDEDFDGLSSGAAITNLFLDWRDLGLKTIDYARIDASGLGGDPYQHLGIRFGSKDTYDLTFNYRSQDYLYSLFQLYGDEDGHTWSTKRRISNLKFTYYVTPKANVFFEFRDNQRSGNSLFMKYIEGDLFRLETPIDIEETRYAVGTTLNVGPVDVYFRQTLRDYENDFNNFTEGNAGLNLTDLTTLDSYDWQQRERGDGNLSELKIHAALGERVDLTLGTLIGDDDLTNRVNVNAGGTGFSGTCAVGGGACDTDADCDAIVPGDVCVANPVSVTDGSSDTRAEVDYTVFDADLSWTVIEKVILHFRYWSLHRNLRSTGEIDLSGTGVPVGAGTTIDWSVDSLAFIVEAHPIPTLTFDVGYRVRDRALDRNGFLGNRNADFKSDGDETVVAGLAWRPIDWFRLDADYEDADNDQAFTNVSPYEVKRKRIRTLFTPLDDDMRIDLSYLDFENTNNATDFRPFNTFFGSSIDGTTWSGSFWYRPIPAVDFLLRYAEQEIDSVTNVIYDLDLFGSTAPGTSVFDNTNEDLLVRVNFSWAEPWNAYVRYWSTQSDGANPLLDAAGMDVNCLLPPDGDPTAGRGSDGLGVRPDHRSGLRGCRGGSALHIQQWSLRRRRVSGFRLRRRQQPGGLRRQHCDDPGRPDVLGPVDEQHEHRRERGPRTELRRDRQAGSHHPGLE
jgi:hypothetical protein